MGNRGDLHSPNGHYNGDLSARDAWISCTLCSENGHRVRFDRPGHYYPLFFLDEAVAMAAGHRPCGRCRPVQLVAFKDAWKAAFAINRSSFLSVTAIDEVLRNQSALSGALDLPGPSLVSLPSGTFINASEYGACLVWGDKVFPWTWGGYKRAISIELVQHGRILTSRAMIEVLAQGYRPLVHPSASAGR